MKIQPNVKQGLENAAIPAVKSHASDVNTAVNALKNHAAGKNLDTSESDVVISAVKPSRKNDQAHDGAILGEAGLFSPLADLSMVSPVQPNNGIDTKETLILVNGIMTDVDLQQKDMQALANTGAEVFGVHNSTNGLAADLLECVTDKMGIGDNTSVNTLGRLLSDALLKDAPIRIVAHSQGALIIANALLNVKKSLSDAGVDDNEIKNLMGNISVETFGGASQTFVDGPEYKHFINKADVVPMLSGLGLDAFNPFGSAGQDAKIVKFFETKAPSNLPDLSEGVSWKFARVVDRTVHGPQDIYFRHRMKAGDE